MRLVVLEEPGILPGIPQPKEFELQPDPTRPFLMLGRRTNNDIVILDYSISRHHAEMQIRDDGLIVRDLSSSNGSYLNDQKLDPYDSVLARPGDKLRFGSVVMAVEESLSLSDPLARRSQPGAIYWVEHPETAAAASSNGRASVALEDEPVELAPTLDELSSQPAAIQRDDPSALPPPEEVERIVESRIKPVPKSRPKNGAFFWILLLILIALLIGVGVAIYFSISSQTPTAAAQTPSLVDFASPSKSDIALGLPIVVGADWKKANPNENLVLYILPNTTTGLFKVERLPNAPSIMTPEEAVREHLAQLTNGSTSSYNMLNAKPIKLKDEVTEAYTAKVVFSGKLGDQTVKDYTLRAVSFRCGGMLYLVSSGEQATLLHDWILADLEAALGNLVCK